MITVNITPKTREIAESAGLYVEPGMHISTLKDGTELQRPTIEIGENSSDFFIAYGLNSGGSYSLISHPDYVEDLPACIDTSLKLRAVVQYAAAEVQAS